MSGILLVVLSALGRIAASAADPKAAPGEAAVFEIIEVVGKASVGGQSVEKGRKLLDGEELKVEGQAVLRAPGHILMVRAPAILRVIAAPQPGFSLASGSVIGVRRKDKARIWIMTPDTDQDIGFAAFFVQPVVGGTYLCICDSGEKNHAADDKRRHVGTLWSKDGIASVKGLVDHSEKHLAYLRRLARE